MQFFFVRMLSIETFRLKEVSFNIYIYDGFCHYNDDDNDYNDDYYYYSYGFKCFIV